MEKLFSQTAKDMKPSVIRSLLKLVQQSDIISFAGGTPDAELFPRQLLAELASKVILEQGKLSLQYGETIGWRPLREQVMTYLRGKGIACELDNILITTGSQQGLALLSMVILDPQDAVLVEDPSYLGGLLTFKNFKARLEPVPCDSQGIKMDGLEEILKGGIKPKFLYTIPTFQNPAGTTLPEERRKKLLELASRHDLFVVEDDPYGELNFGEQAVRSIKSFDTEGRVAYLGSFSKICSPGMRLGWVCADAKLVAAMTMAKETVDVCTDVLSQAIATEFFKGGHFSKHLKSLVGIYKRRRDYMLKAIAEHFPKEVRYTHPQGGFFLWTELPKGLNTVELFSEAIKQKVAYVVGTAFHAREGEGLNTLRMAFCAVDEPKIEEGIKRLGKVFEQALVKA